MKHTVYKYPVPVLKEVVLTMPEGAELLHFGVDSQDQLCLWARVDLSAQPVPRHFLIAGTGHDLGYDNLRHVGTCLVMEEMWHLFERV